MTHLSKNLPALVFVVFAAVSLTGCGVASALDLDTSVRIEDHTVSADGIDLVDVGTENGMVEIRAGADNDIEIRSLFREHDAGEAEATIRVDGERLVITGECDGRGWWNRCSVGFVVTVPPHLDVRATTDNGRVHASDLTGDVSIESDNGRVHGSALGGDVSIATDNGSITATDLGGAASVTAESDNGKIHLTFVEAPASVEALSDNGSITVRLPRDDTHYAVEAHSGNGDVDVDVRADPNAARPIDARSDNGKIAVEYHAP